METKPNYYSNPAFCQQSEFYSQKRALSPQGSVRHSPVGAQTSHVVLDNSFPALHQEDEKEELVDDIEEQEFYEEVIVDNNGFIKGKKVVVVAQNNEGRKYIQVPPEERKGSRYGVVPKIHQSPLNSPLSHNQKSRYEYIPMQEQDPRFIPASARSTPKKVQQVQEEHVEVFPGVVHRYAVIEAEEETELTNKSERYALVPVNQLNSVVSTQNKNRYEYIQDSPPAKKIQEPSNPSNNRYEYIQNSPTQTNTRYEYISQSVPQTQTGTRYDYLPPNSPRPGTNPIATQRLHELLSTPKKTRNLNQGQALQKVISPQPPRRIASPPLSPINKDPFETPKRSPQKTVRPPTNSKVQQKLNYAIGSKQLLQDKRHTAIVTPMCSSPIQSVYSETTYSQKSESWMNLSVKRNAAGQALAVAALIMFLCGMVTSGLCFYMISLKGRLYYLDFSTIAGFACVVMGLLGFRSRNVYWLPNRNYTSGYLVLSLFSLLTCVGLLVLLVYNPRPGTPLADMTSAAVCGFSVLTLLLALTGVVSSYCCKYPPPDNRVQHCSPGFTV